MAPLSTIAEPVVTEISKEREPGMGTVGGGCGNSHNCGRALNAGSSPMTSENSAGNVPEGKKDWFLLHLLLSVDNI